VIKGTPKNPQPTAAAEPVVYVIDDDPGMRDALGLLFRSVGLHVELFKSAGEFMERNLPSGPSCLVLDVRLPGKSGFEFHAELTKAKNHIPIVFITGHGDIPMSVRAMKGGAVDFLTKPFRDQDMLDAVTAAIAGDRARRDAERARLRVQDLFDGLTPREQKVMALVTAGLMNKQVAADLGLSEITVKIHRGRLMRKMQAHSLADLVRMAGVLGIERVKRS
jgi:FixJ family two-component response regulator